MNDTENDVSIDDILSAFGDLPKEHLTPEDEFYDNYTKGKCPKIANLRYTLNAWELPRFQFLKSKGVSLTIKVEEETKAIPGAVSAKPLRVKSQQDLTQAEFIKLVIEYYLMMHHLPHFLRTEDAPHRQVCSLSKVVDMLAEHESIKELRDKKY